LRVQSGAGMVQLLAALVAAANSRRTGPASWPHPVPGPVRLRPEQAPRSADADADHFPPRRAARAELPGGVGTEGRLVRQGWLADRRLVRQELPRRRGCRQRAGVVED